jgi:hypothetical protein
MNSLKITETSGVAKIIPDGQVLEVEITDNLITSVSFIDNAQAPTTEAVAAFTGANKKYEYGCFIPGNIFSAYVANYKTR